jgi:hypothetical protein
VIVAFSDFLALSFSRVELLIANLFKLVVLPSGISGFLAVFDTILFSLLG